MDNSKYSKYCNYCDSTTHYYNECALMKLQDMFKGEWSVPTLRQTIIPQNTPITYPDVNWNETGDSPVDMWGSFWASEHLSSGYEDMQGPDDWYKEGGHGDS